jgi:hypothetical protein
LAEVRVSKRYAVPAQGIWARIGDPARLAEWHPYIERTDLLDNGKRRVNTTADGSRVTETILEQAARHHTWQIDDGPLPYERFVATMRVQDNRGGCIVECDATFEPKDGAHEQAEELTRGFFQAGLDAIG